MVGFPSSVCDVQDYLVPNVRKKKKVYTSKVLGAVALLTALTGFDLNARERRRHLGRVKMWRGLRRLVYSMSNVAFQKDKV